MREGKEETKSISKIDGVEHECPLSQGKKKVGTIHHGPISLGFRFGFGFVFYVFVIFIPPTISHLN